jgi:hypothetical protein
MATATRNDYSVGDKLVRGNGSTVWEVVRADGGEVAVRKLGSEGEGGSMQDASKFRQASPDEVAAYTPTERRPRNSTVPSIAVEVAGSLPKAIRENPYVEHVMASWNGNPPEDSTDPDNEGAVLSFPAPENVADKERAIGLLRTAANGSGLGIKIREANGRVYFQARTKRERNAK